MDKNENLIARTGTRYSERNRRSIPHMWIEMFDKHSRIAQTLFWITEKIRGLKKKKTKYYLLY